MAKHEKARQTSGSRPYEGPFLAVPLEVLRSPAWAAMSAHEVKLLLDIAEAYRGDNNGDLSCTWREMSQKGWASRDTLAKALSGLLEKGMIVLTRQGGRRTCNLYALTWRGIDECNGKLDVPATLNASCAWRSWRPESDGFSPPGVSKRPKFFDTPAVSSKHGGRAKELRNGTF